MVHVLSIGINKPVRYVITLETKMERSKCRGNLERHAFCKGRYEGLEK